MFLGHVYLSPALGAISVSEVRTKWEVCVCVEGINHPLALKSPSLVGDTVCPGLRQKEVQGWVEEPIRE